MAEKKPVKLFDAFIENLVFALSLGYVIVSFLQVLFRYVFNQSLSWSEELCRYLFVWTVFIGSGIGLYHRKHVNVDLLEKALPIHIRRYFILCLDLCVIGFLVFFLIVGTQLALKNMTQLSPAMGIPLGYIYISIPFGSIVMLIYAVRAAVISFKKLGSANKSDS